jgi:hypothetical protein
MATITERKLTISHNHDTRTAKCTVTAKVNFTLFEFNQMREGLRFRLRCTLWGDDAANDSLQFTYPTVKMFPDGNPTRTESIKFEATLGEGVLNEDQGVDEIYGKLTLLNTFTNQSVNGNTNVVTHSFPAEAVIGG